jgi:hypothetical protein
MVRNMVSIGLILAFFITASTVYAQGPGTKHSDPEWQASYWNNTTLSGTPVLEEKAKHLGFDWEYGSPHPLIRTDQFSARWSRYLDLEETSYRFSVTSDDGVRVYVDDRLIIDEWHDHPARTFTADLSLNAGHHLVVVEYYENTGVAKAALAWWPLSAGTGTWQGQYYDNPTLSGSPVRTRVDDEIDFDWGYGSPAPQIAGDGFSVRWTRTLGLESGLYRFTTTTDDGVRLWVNDHLLIDRWVDQAARSHSGTIHVSGDTSIKMEYYERGGVAVARLDWMRLGDAPPPPDEIIVDDGDPGFMQGGSSTAWRTEAYGYNDDMTWTRNNDWARPNYNWARWYPDLSPGRYEVYVYIPQDRASTANARYWIAHHDGFTLRKVDQSEHRGQWVSLGTYRFQGTKGDYLSLSDVTYETYLWRQIAFDAAKWVPR